MDNKNNKVNFNGIILYLSNERINNNNKEYFCNYIEDCKIIINKGNYTKLNNKMFKFDDEINYNNYDFSDRFINIKIIISLLEIFDLTKLNTHNIHDFFNNNKKKYNIWKYLSESEYINCNVPSNYDKLVILRICLTYSWEECLYDLLNNCLNNNKNYKTFIWIDIFCVNQFNQDIKMKGLNNIDKAYYIADIYNISSLKAFERYWCFYEMSLNKKSKDGFILNETNLVKSDKIANIIKKIIDNIFNNNNNFDSDNNIIYKYMLEFQKIKEFKKNKFSLKNAKIKYNKDKYFIESKIINKYNTIEEYEKRLNMYIYLMIYRDDMKHLYLANKIMNFPLNEL